MAEKKTSVKRDLDAILTVLTKIGDASPVDIEKELAGQFTRRTLQRRLKQLIAVGMIEPVGNTRSLIYHMTAKGIAQKSIKQSQQTSLIPLSNEGREIQEIISKPIEQRHPVGYHREFLDAYEPNRSSYLTETEKSYLVKIGVTGFTEAAGGTYAKQILQRLLIDLAWNSSRLEGNTYSLLDTQLLIDKGRQAENKSAFDAQMILNHKEAIEFIVKDGEDIGFNRYTILNLHAMLANNLLPNPAAPGRLRSQPVGIAASVFRPLEMPQRIEELFEVVLTKAKHIKNPFEQSFFIMVQLPYLQPFDDVNKRVSRLAANIPFVKNNLSPLSFTDVPQQLYTNGLLGVYELNRIELLKDVFLWAYERSAQLYAAQRQSLGDPDPFRIRYRSHIRYVIKDIIVNVVPKDAASTVIEAYAMNHISSEDQTKFSQIVENELYSLHEGNFARYDVRPSEFKQWHEVWNS